MHFGFALELSNVDVLNTDLLDTHLDLLDTDISSKYFVFFFVSIMSSRRLQDMSSRRLQAMSSRRLQDMSSRRLQDMSWRRLLDVFCVTIFCLPRCLQHVFKTSYKMSSRLLFKMSSRRLGRRKIVTLKTCGRRLQDQQRFAGIWRNDKLSKMYVYFLFLLFFVAIIFPN